MCSDTDNDSVMIAHGSFDTANDGVDFDSDGACDAGDTDDDNDGALDADDSDDNDANVCSDTDNDSLMIVQAVASILPMTASTSIAMAPVMRVIPMTIMTVP